MGKRLLTKTPRVNESGELLVNYSANRVGGLQLGFFSTGSETKCVPLGVAGGSPLRDRKYLLMTVALDRVYFGTFGVDESNGYAVRGPRRGGNWELAPDIDDYSNRKQFLRGQYMTLPLLPSVTFCVRFPISVEEALSLETS